MKNIWIIVRSPILENRPIISVLYSILALGGYKAKLISTASIGKSIDGVEEFVFKTSKSKNKFYILVQYWHFRKFVKEILEEHGKEDDIIWLGSLDIINCCTGLSIFKKYKYICHIRELYDQHLYRLKLSKKFIQQSYKVVVPEINRARILQVWLELDKLPTVLPNKPMDHPRKKYITPTIALTKKIIDENYNKDKKIIVYQGHIEKKRSLEPIIHAIKDIPNVEFWLMGQDHNYVDSLLNMSSQVKYFGYIPGPYYLEITSYADLGVMSYDLIDLNHMYCAPNKVWEYLGFDIPFICNEVGSLDDFINKGCCSIIDFDQPSEIKRMILKNIEKKQDFSELYNSVDTKNILSGIINV